jgi:1-acyl-sn-glycerol-3-phosphate acyltransferase
MFQKKLGLLCKLVDNNFQIQISGLDHIERDRNYVFAMNHQSIVDIPIAFAVLFPRTDKKITLFMSTGTYAFFYPLMRPLDALRINMKKRMSEKSIHFNKGQIIKGIRRLRSGGSALIYPEGTSIGGRESQILRGETGVIRLALRSGVPIIPIGIRGSNHAYPFPLRSYNPFLFRTKHPIQVNIGEPICLCHHQDIDFTRRSDQTRQILRQLTEDLMDRLANLSCLPKVRKPGPATI